MKTRFLRSNSSSAMKDRHQHKGLKWNGLYHSSSIDMSGLCPSNKLHLPCSSEEWNAEVKMQEVEICNVQMIITNVETDLEKEERMNKN